MSGHSKWATPVKLLSAKRITFSYGKSVVYGVVQRQVSLSTKLIST